MIVSIDKDLQPRLLEAANFKAFRVEVPAGAPFEDISKAVHPVVLFEGDEVAWVSSSWLRDQCNDEAWLQGLAAMVEKARPFGWIRDTPEPSIRAHVKRVGAG